MSHNVNLTGIEQDHLNKRKQTAGERTTEGEDDFCSECELACTVDPTRLSIENNGLQDQNKAFWQNLGRMCE